MRSGSLRHHSRRIAIAAARADFTSSGSSSELQMIRALPDIDSNSSPATSKMDEEK